MKGKCYFVVNIEKTVQCTKIIIKCKINANGAETGLQIIKIVIDQDSKLKGNEWFTSILIWAILETMEVNFNL